MLKITQKKSNVNYFNNYINDMATEDVVIKHWFDINEQENTIHYKLITNDVSVFDFIVDFEQFKEHQHWSDQNLFAIHANHIEILKTKNNIDNNILSSVFNHTLDSKVCNPLSPTTGFSTTPFFIFVPSKNCNINDLEWIVLAPNASDTITVELAGPSGNGVTFDTIEQNIPITELVTPINVSGPSSITTDSTFTLNVSVSDQSIKEIFVDPIVATSNKSRIYLTNGSGSLEVSTAGLVSGEEVKLKFGYKYFTGVATYTKVIS